MLQFTLYELDLGHLEDDTLLLHKLPRTSHNDMDEGTPTQEDKTRHGIQQYI